MKNLILTLLCFWVLQGLKAQNAAPNKPLFENATLKNLPAWALAGRNMDAKPVDIDKDGDLDLVIACEFEPNIILLNDGKGNFVDGTKGRIAHKREDSEDITIEDFDQDGDLDIIFVSEDSKTNEYYLNDGKVFFKDISDRLPVKGTSNAVISVDLDQDGDMDILIGNNGQNRALINDGKGNFIDKTSNILPQINDITQDLEIGDVDGDGDLDILVANEDDNKLLLNNGKGVFEDKTEGRLPLISNQEETREADFGDIDSDGDLDIIFANVAFQKGKNNQNRILINDGKGSFSDETSKRLPSQKFHSLDADFVDLDNDKDLDIIVANGFGGGFQFLINDGKGGFTDETSIILPEKIFILDGVDAEVADFNGDGLVDIFVTNFRGSDKLFLQKKR